MNTCTVSASAHLSINLLAEDVLQCDGISSKFRYAFPQLLNSHCLFVEIETEQRLVVDVGFLWDVESRGVFSVQFQGYFICRIE